MLTVLRWIWFCGLLIAFGVGLAALHNWMFGKNVPLWLGPITLLSFGAGTALLLWCQRKGWIKGAVWRLPKELEDRKRALDADREKIIAELAAKGGSRD